MNIAGIVTLCLEQEQVLTDGVSFYLCKMLNLLRLAELAKQMQHLSVVFDCFSSKLLCLPVYQKGRNLSFQMNLLIQNLYSQLVFFFENMPASLLLEKHPPNRAILLNFIGRILFYQG